MSDNYTYAKLALFIGPKERLSDTDLHELSAQVNEDSELAQSIIDVAKVSMGQAVSFLQVLVSYNMLNQLSSFRTKTWKM